MEEVGEVKDELKTTLGIMPLKWGNGGLYTSTGLPYASPNIRTEYLAITSEIIVENPFQRNISVFEYDTNDGATDCIAKTTGITTKSKTISLTAETLYIRLMVGSNPSNINDANGIVVRTSDSGIASDVVNNAITRCEYTFITSSNITAPYDDLDTFPDNMFAIFASNSGVAHSPYNTNRFRIVSFSSNATPLGGGVGRGSVQIAIDDYANISIRTSSTRTWTGWSFMLNKNEGISKCTTAFFTSETVTAPYDDFNTLPDNMFLLYAGVIPSHAPVNLVNNQMSVLTFNSNSGGSVGRGSAQIIVGNREAYMRTSNAGIWREWVDLSTLQGLYGTVKTIISKPLNISPSNTFLFLGDSITAKASLQRGDPWVDYVMAHFGVPSTNYKNGAIGGADYGYDGAYIIDELSTELAIKDDYDYIYIAAGVNDFRGNVTMENFNTALNAVSAYLADHYNGHVIIQTPIQSPENPVNTASRRYNLIDYSNALFVWAMKNGYDCVNGFDLGFAYEPEDYVSAIYATDKLHPNDLGMQIYARGVENALG